MLIDVTLPITPSMIDEAQKNERKALTGHLGTHFDVMNKVFPLEYTQREGIVWDVSAVKARDINLTDVDIGEVRAGMFVAFCTGFIERVDYGTPVYFSTHPQLSVELIEALVNRGVSIIGVDSAGVRRGKEHTPIDQYCADRGVFVVENLHGLRAVLEHAHHFTAYTFPMNIVGLTGLPCRVIAQV